MKRSTAVIGAMVIVDVALFLLSGIPRFRDAEHGADLVIGELFWIGFLIGALALIVLGGFAIARRLNRKERAS